MIRLTNAALPSTVYPQRPASFLRLYQTSDHPLAPLFRFDVFGLFLGQDTTYSPLDIPDYAGLLYRIRLEFLFEIVACHSFRLLESPLDASPQTMWGEDQSLNFYDSYIPTLIPGGEITLQLQVNRTIPEPDQFRYEIDLTSLVPIVVESVTATGLTFLPADDSTSPQPGEFLQNGTRLILYGSAELQIRPADQCSILASKTVAVPEPTAWALTFDLSDSDLEIVVAAEYLGGQYTIADNPFLPQVGDLFWQPPFMTLFTKLAIGKPQVKSKIEVGEPSIGTTVYSSYS